MFFHPQLDLSSGFFPLMLPSEMLQVFSNISMRATSLANIWLWCILKLIWKYLRKNIFELPEKNKGN